jgi:hypothetical protein
LTVTVTKVIRYKTHPEIADENECLIRDVFTELAEQQPPGLHYLLPTSPVPTSSCPNDPA